MPRRKAQETTDDAAPEAAAETHFGFETVPLSEKQERVNDVFHAVARRYDVMNDVMSLGLHRAWKETLVAMLRPPSHRDFRVLDVAGGTGDVAFRILEAGGARTSVTVLDINGDMLAVGKERAEQRNVEGRLDFLEANAEALPLPEKSIDAYTIAFGIRNVPRIDVALKEAFRVLKTGGRLLVLEFAPVDAPVIDRLYEAYSFNLIPPLGRMITGDAGPYQYLVESIRKFPKPDAFARMIGAAGFRRVDFRPMSAGIVNIHSGWKL
jgi:demethylmenaquinone methyltransferase / 2-methoxy-6-polyprenyl-1,4-benzoquinol methylase